jgi:hypothetical protein
MVIKKSQEQRSAGNNSTLYQSDRDIVINHNSNYQEMRQISLDVYKANCLELKDIASKVAYDRATEITDKLLNKIVKISNDFNFASDPDFQYLIYSMQTEFARTGDEYLGDLLTDVITDRSQNKDRDILQITLNESVAVIPKLTRNQINALSIIQIFFHTKFTANNPNDFERKFQKIYNLTKGVESLSESDFLHLQYSGSLSINHLLKKDILREYYEKYKNIWGEDLSVDKFDSFLSENCPNLHKCINLVNKKEMHRCELTSVGMLIGLANLKRIFPDINYKTWIK